MNHWLMKSEPSVFSIDDLERAPKRTTMWDGVRNYQARNMIRDQMRPGDEIFFYHASCPDPGIYGIAKVVKAGYPDPTQFIKGHDHEDPKSSPEDPRWYVIDAQLVRKMATPILLETLKIKDIPAINEMLIMRRGNRLSVTPVTPQEWAAVLLLESSAAGKAR